MLLPLLVLVLIVDAFGDFFTYLPPAAVTVARILTWVGVVGLYISPRVLGGMTQWNMNGLEFLSAPGVALGGTPDRVPLCRDRSVVGMGVPHPESTQRFGQTRRRFSKRPELGIALRTVQKTPAS